MIIKKKLIFLPSIIFLVSTLFFIQSVSALTANSSSYSVSMFGTGMATATPSSTNYNSTMLSEAQGTTRNAESGTYTTNVGFFENTIYYRTVSITSYSIYPKSAVQGSIIRLSISALNFQLVWAVLTPPTGTPETIALTNNVNAYYTANSVGVYTVTFYANSSQGNLASVIDTFEITSPVTPPVTPPSSGGGTTTVIEKCTYIWDCTPWSICSEGIQQRECKNIGNCTGTEGKPIETRECSDALFDVVMKFKDVELTANKTLKFGIDLTETKGVEKIDVQIKYSIIDSKNTEVFSQIETRAIEGNLTYEKEISEIKLKDGEYTLRVDIIYGNQQRAFAEQKFKVIDEKVEIKEPTSTLRKMIEFLRNYKIIFGIAIFLIVLVLLIIFFLSKKYSHKKTKKSQSKVKKHLKKIKRRHVIFILGIALIGTLFFAGHGITGFATRTLTFEKGSIGVIWFILITGIIGALIFLSRNKIKVTLEKIKERIKTKYPTNSIMGLVNKKVYSESGYYMGKIKEVILGENRIESLKIKIDKKHKFKTKGVIIDYKHVKGVSEIIIVDEKVSEHLIYGD